MLRSFYNKFIKKNNEITYDYDDNITIVEDKLSNNYLSSMDKSKSSSTYTNYISDYDTEIDLDKPIKNKLLNIDGEIEEVFKLKNNFYSNYGFEAYISVLNKYNILKKNLIMNFYKDIWDKATHIYLKADNNKTSCFPMFYVNKNNQSINDIYNTLLNIHIKSIKTKLWIDCCNEYKCNI
jgi:hypothetical protein